MYRLSALCSFGGEQDAPHLGQCNSSLSMRDNHLDEPLAGLLPDKGVLVLGSIEFHALLSLLPVSSAAHTPWWLTVSLHIVHLGDLPNCPLWDLYASKARSLLPV